MRKRKNVGWRDGFDREGSKMMDECGEADKGLEICSGLSELERGLRIKVRAVKLLAAVAAVLLRLHRTHFNRLCWFANAAGRC